MEEHLHEELARIAGTVASTAKAHIKQSRPLGEGLRPPAHLSPSLPTRLRSLIKPRSEAPLRIKGAEPFEATVYRLSPAQSISAKTRMRHALTASVMIDGEAIERTGAHRASALSVSRIVLGTEPTRHILATGPRDALILILAVRGAAPRV